MRKRTIALIVVLVAAIGSVLACPYMRGKISDLSPFAKPAVEESTWLNSDAQMEATGINVFAYIYSVRLGEMLAIGFSNEKCLGANDKRVYAPSLSVNGVLIKAVFVCKAEGLAYLTAKTWSGNEYIMNSFKTQKEVIITQGKWRFTFTTKGFLASLDKVQGRTGGI